MCTLISARNSEGEYGRCDAKCYNAEHKDCHCICGGANHGKGYDQALSNTETHADEWIQEFSDAHGIRKKDFFVTPRVNQTSIFNFLSPFIIRPIRNENKKRP